jgi:Tfp pilus assembly protein PilO
VSPGKKREKLPLAAQIGLVLLAVVVVSVAGYLLLVAPKKKDASDAKAEAAKLQQELIAGRTAAGTAEQQSKIRVADAFRLTKAMPDSPDVGEIVLQLSALADDAGISFDSIRPGDPLAGNGFTVEPINVSFQGSFYELSDFLYKLRNLVLVRSQELLATGRLFTVDSISFGQGVPDFPNISAQLTIDAYVYGAPPTTTTTTTTSTTTTSTTTTSTTAASAASAPPSSEIQGAAS